MFGVLKASLLFIYDSDADVRRFNVECLVTMLTFSLKTAKPIASYNIMDTEIKQLLSDKEKRGASHAFKIMEPNVSSVVFKTEKEIECMDWVESVNQGRRICQRSENVAVDPAQVRTTSKQEITNNLISLLEQAGNQYCADCGSSGAFWMLTNYGALVCFDCADVHETLNTSPIKAIHFDQWTVDDTMVSSAVYYFMGHRY